VVILFEGATAPARAGSSSGSRSGSTRAWSARWRCPRPSDREKTQWYFQRYVPHLPAGGEIVLFDRSWYNRAGVERVMGFASEAEVEQFFRDVPSSSGCWCGRGDGW
jgi:polyphosphate kinase 2 (PPK2 family)